MTIAENGNGGAAAKAEHIRREGEKILSNGNLFGKTIVLMPFGSTLYGLETEGSDLDFKGIYVPSLEEVMERREKESLRVEARAKKKGERNGPGDVDCEFFSFGKFVAHALSGQTLAFDMLHAPYGLLVATSDVWTEMVRHRKLFLSKRIMRFVEYARNQARKYGVKGSRLAFVRDILLFLGSLPPDIKIGDKCGKNPSVMIEFARLGEKHRAADGRSFVYLDGPEHSFVEICGKRFQPGTKVKNVVECMMKIEGSLDGRSEDAMKAGGVDWKAVSHAFRALIQARLLAEEGEFSYPLPQSDFLMRIKRGVEDYEVVGPMLEAELEETRDVVDKSCLPETPVKEAYAFVEELRGRIYGRMAQAISDEAPFLER